MHLPDAHAYHLRSGVLSSAGTIAAMNEVVGAVQVPYSDRDKENDQ